MLKSFLILTLIGGCITLATQCAQKKSLPAPLFQKDTTQVNERNNTLFAFVGEKISVRAIPQEEGSMDGAVKATYRVLVPVYGNYDKDTISFTAYDHFGRFAFARSTHALLYVTEYEGAFYHQKYQYNAVYRTRNGRWAGDGRFDSYADRTVKPEQIDFIDTAIRHVVVTDLKGRPYDMGFDTPYFRTDHYPKGAVYGNYIEELFKLKKNGVLRYRDLFGDKPYEIEPVQLEEIKQDPPKAQKAKRQ